jgi:ABC-2 type transport system permease protein
VMVFAAVSACYTNLAISVPITRDEGILKRVRGTPLPSTVYVAARIVSAVWMSLLASVLMVVVGVVLFHVEVIWRLLPAAVVTLLVGAASFCALGLAVASLVPNGESAPAIANFTWLPVAFISDIFFPLDSAPQWLKTLGDVFPVKHFANAMQADFTRFTASPGFFWRHLAVIVAWAVVAVVVAVRNFKWEPQSADGPRRVTRARRG